jgi:hypothetical protein
VFFTHKIGSGFKATITSQERKRTPIIIQKTLLLKIDQKTNLAIITAVNHPDIGALKRNVFFFLTEGLPTTYFKAVLDFK